MLIPAQFDPEMAPMIRHTATDSSAEKLPPDLHVSPMRHCPSGLEVQLRRLPVRSHRSVPGDLQFE